MSIDVIAVLVVFLIFSIGGTILIKKAEKELNSTNNNHSDKENEPVLKHKKGGKTE